MREIRSEKDVKIGKWISESSNRKREELPGTCKEEKQEIFYDFVGIGRQKLTCQEIMYIESNLHEVKFYLSDHATGIKYRVYRKLNEVEEELDSNIFIRIHQSFLVNIAYIRQISRKGVILKDGQELFVSKSRYMAAKKAIEEYI